MTVQPDGGTCVIVGALSFAIKDPAPPAAAEEATPVLDLSGFSGLATQVDMQALTAMVNTAVAAGPVSLPEMVGMFDSPYLAEVVVLWALALKQDSATSQAGAQQVRFLSLDGRDRVMDVPAVMFREPVPSLEEL